LKPKISAQKPPEDLFEEIEGDGTMVSAKWGDREWTKKVEQAYWHDLPTPPPSRESSPCPAGFGDALSIADGLAVRVLIDLCKPEAVPDGAWDSPMDAAAEEARRRFFRTQYRAVESEVVGIQVKW